MVAEEIKRHHREEDENPGNQNSRIAREILHVLGPDGWPLRGEAQRIHDGPPSG